MSTFGKKFQFLLFSKTTTSLLKSLTEGRVIFDVISPCIFLSGVDFFFQNIIQCTQRLLFAKCCQQVFSFEIAGVTSERNQDLIPISGRPQSWLSPFTLNSNVYAYTRVK